MVYHNFDIVHTKIPIALCILILLFNHRSNAALDPNAVIFSCPSTHDTLTPLTGVDSSLSSDNVVIELPISQGDNLCALSSVENGVYIPFGRSYDGNDWERPAGKMTRLSFICEGNGTNRKCQVTIPKPKTANDSYYLASYRSNYTSDQEVSRFLERTTFGPRRSDLSSWDNSISKKEAMVNWVKDQIENKPLTSHREYYRKRLNPRSIETYKIGASGPSACEMNSRWRRFAFTNHDMFMSAKVNKFNLEIRPVTVDGVTAYILSFANHTRTVIYEELVLDEDNSVKLDMTGSTSYQICWAGEIVGGIRDYHDAFRLKVDGSCKDIKGGNPSVILDETYMSTLSNWPAIQNRTLDFSSLDNSTLVTINFEKTKDSKYLLTQAFSDSKCSSLPNPTDNSYLNNPPSRENPDPPVFTKLPDGKYAIHDFRLRYFENSAENPKLDGGGNLVVDTSNGGDNQIMLCANVRRNIFNEDFCKLSMEPNTCIIYNEKIETIKSRRGGTIVCGSIGEISPDPLEDDYYDNMNGKMDVVEYRYAHKRVWQQIALDSEDQLRQRVAWALSQIMVVSSNSVHGSQNAEGNAMYYDIFVRNAFNNYLDVLRAVSYSPKMAEMLTFIHNKSERYVWDRNKIIQSPDENYAREIMQLFTIGLVELNMDGTSKLDRWGNEINTYDNSDVVTFARAWTGFFYSMRRSNHQDTSHSGHSRVEFIEIPYGYEGRRDWAPKRSLTRGFIGDRYPLCTDMPEQSFLRIGAKFRLLGNKTSPELQRDEAIWENDHSYKKMILSPSSFLYSKLCNSANGVCNYQVNVVLETNLPCFGDECNVSTVRVVQVSEGIHYEYIRQPCVQLAFYENGKKVGSGWKLEHVMCANPKLPVATELCCGVGNVAAHVAVRPCKYVGERVTYQMNENRCTARSGHSCSVPAKFNPNVGDCPDDKCCTFQRNHRKSPEINPFHWTAYVCYLQIKVNIDGSVALLHVPELASGSWLSEQKVVPHVSNETTTFFHIVWEENEPDPTLPTIYPQAGGNQCYNNTCEETSDGMCLCNITVSENIAFTSIPSLENVLSTLSIGSFSPEMLQGYSLLSESTTTVKVYSNNAQNYTIDTIFQVTDEYGEKVYLKNMISKINVAGKIEVKNPVHFMDMVDPEIRDVYYETEAVLQHFVHHPNTPPFVAINLIKRFGISNPSPRFVEAVALAFKSGRYEFTSGSLPPTSFGDGKWGNLASTVAAIMLDDEATTSVLDWDPAYGTLQEPLLKVMRFMRSMEYARTIQDNNVDQMLNQMQSKIGQMAYDSPDQFSFFSPFYSPGGQFATAKLVTPEAEALTISQTVGILNGFFGLSRTGLNPCEGGFGGYNRKKYNNIFCRSYDDQYLTTGDYNKSTGFLAYSPSSISLLSSDVVNELSTLLTSGRLSKENKAIIVEAYDYAKNLHDQDMAVRVAQQLIATTPEFHSNNHHRTDSNPREPSPENSPNSEPYKAIVMVYLFGGMDSYNMLVPHPDCYLYDEYKDERDYVHLDSSKLVHIDATGSGQPCSKFSLNQHFDGFKQIYDEGKGLFFANTGHLPKPVMKENYREEVKTQLFSHNTMETELYRVDAFKEQVGTGVLGRMLDKLQERTYAITPISIGRTTIALSGDPAFPRSMAVIPSGGWVDFYPTSISQSIEKEYMKDKMKMLNSNGVENNGLFGDLWSQLFIDNWNRTEFYRNLINSAAVDTSFPNSNLGNSLKKIAKLIKTHASRNKNRDIFFSKIGGFDHHFDSKSNAAKSFKPLDDAVLAFYQEMKAQGNLDKVTFIVTSEFGRTINPNTAGGTDHAWGGNYFLFGGEVDGGKILGDYPASFRAAHSTNIGRGRLIPTTSWDAVFNGIANWFGITDDDELTYVIPNRNNHGCRLFTDKDIYVNGQKSISGCGAGTVTMTQNIQMVERRFLTGDEQIKLCALFVGIAQNTTGEKSRCVIVSQKIVDSNNGFDRNLQRSRITSESVTLKIEYEMSSDKEGFDEALKTEMNNQIDEIGSDLTEIVPNSTSISVVQTANPIPELQPVEPPTLVPSAEPSEVPSQLPSESLIPSKKPSVIKSEGPTLSITAPITSLPKYIPHVPAIKCFQKIGVDIEGSVVTNFDENDYISYANLNFGLPGLQKSIHIRYAKGNDGGKLELRLDGPSGNVIGEYIPLNTGGWNQFIDVNIPIADTAGFHHLTFVGKETYSILNLEWIVIHNKGSQSIPPCSCHKQICIKTIS